MRKKNAKMEEKLLLLIDKLEENGRLSIKEITAILGCNRQSAHNYLSRLTEKGIPLTRHLINNQAFYSIEEMPEKLSDSIHYLPMTADVLRKYAIIQVLQRAPMTLSDLRKMFSKEYKDRDHYCIDIGQTHFYQLLKELIQTGEIAPYREKSFDSEKYLTKYYLTGNSVPLIWTVDIDELYNTYDLLSNLSPGVPYFEQLKSVCQKLHQILGAVDEETLEFRNYQIYGRNLKAFDEMSTHREQLKKYDYKNKILEIEYDSKKGNHHSILFAVGLVVYSMEKDSIYLMGETPENNSEDESSHLIINIRNIINIRGTDIPHKCYNSEFYQKAFKTMFSISTEPSETVTVEFDPLASIKTKLDILRAQRNVKESADPWLYTDEISGLSDFAGYLRQFGKSAHVKAPATLQEKMMFSVNRSLERYGEI